MKTLDEVLRSFKSEALDGRDASRLALFVPASRLGEIGVELKPDATWEAKEWTRENLLAQLRADVAFGFEKALNQRGISSSLMANVVMMWNVILEDGLQDFKEYAQYGLPLFKATAIKYGFDNPIGDKSGTEHEFASS